MNSETGELTGRAALAHAALAYAAEHPWRAVSMARLAEIAGRPAADFHPAAPMDAVEAIEAEFDRRIAATVSEESPRERLFDLAMQRFEAMEPHRAALDAIERSDPLVRMAVTALAVRSARWILGLAGLATQPGDLLRVGPMALILQRARAAWRKDTAGDFARTMVSLDRDLRQAEQAEMQLAPLRSGFGLLGGTGGKRGQHKAGAQAAEGAGREQDVAAMGAGHVAGDR